MKNDKFDIMLRGDDDFGLFNPFFKDMFEPFKEFRTFDRVMKTDVKENEKEYELEIDMPGFDKKDINLNLKDGYLTIHAQKEDKLDEKDKKGNYIRRERKYGSCSRSFYVGDIKEEDIKAKLDSGVLTIVVPKEKPKQIQNKRIEIE